MYIPHLCLPIIASEITSFQSLKEDTFVPYKLSDKETSTSHTTNNASNFLRLIRIYIYILQPSNLFFIRVHKETGWHDNLLDLLWKHDDNSLTNGSIPIWI